MEGERDGDERGRRSWMSHEKKGWRRTDGEGEPQKEKGWSEMGIWREEKEEHIGDLDLFRS